MTDPAKQRGHQAGPDTKPEAAAPAGGSGATFLQVKTDNEALKVQERRLRLQKLERELVDRARAVALVFRLARQLRDSWSNWPSRVAALIAADLGVSTAAVQAALETHVRANLEELGDVRLDL